MTSQWTVTRTVLNMNVIFLVVRIFTISNYYYYVLAEQCMTPNKESAECVSLYSCPILLGSLGSQQQKAIEFVRNSTCGGDALNPMVCCGTSSTFISKQQEHSRHNNETKQPSNSQLLPSTKICGFQHSDDYFHTTDVTVISEFPWLALINGHYYESKNEGPCCTGSLINIKYVLTAAWCLNNTLFYPTSVRLGDYYLLNKTDCLEDVYGPECVDEVNDVGISKSIPHPLFNETLNINNIGLIRLNGSAKYSDYIRPICLALPNSTWLNTDNTIITASWEFLSTSANQFTKSRCTNSLLTVADCQDKLIQSEVPDKVDESHVCILRSNKRDPLCTLSVEGTPAMFVAKRNQWFLKGIVAKEDFRWDGIQPTILTNVTHYIDWIMNHLEA